MRHLLKQLAETEGGPFGTGLVVGAGLGSDLGELRQFSFQRLILLEPHPDHAGRLSKAIDAMRNEEVWPVAVAGAPCPSAQLHILNNATEASLQAPRKMAQHLPNVKETSVIDIQSLTLKDIIENIGLDESSGQRHVLVLDAPGQFHDLVSSTPPEALQRFSAILARSAVVPLYEYDCAADTTCALLNEIGFSVLSVDPDCIFPYDKRLLVRDCARVQQHRLMGEKAALEARLQQRKAAIAEKDAQIQALKETKSNLTKELNALREKHSNLIQEHSTTLLKEQDDVMRGLELQRQLAEASNKLAAAEQLASEKTTLLQRLEERAGADLAVFQRRVGELETQKQGISADLAVAREKIKRLEEEQATSTRTISLNTQMMMMRENDLSDLQERYRTLLDQRNAQQELLEKLTHRLTTASQYFHQLNYELGEQSGDASTTASLAPTSKRPVSLAIESTVDQEPRRPPRKPRTRQPR